MQKGPIMLQIYLESEKKAAISLLKAVLLEQKASSLMQKALNQS